MNNVLEYLERSAKLFPNKRAVADKDHEYTFSQLALAARSLASCDALRECCGSAVGVFAERNADVIVEFMAVLYAGGFYVPLDPDMPEHKLDMILDNAQIKVVLGSEKCKEKTSWDQKKIKYICYDSSEGIAASEEARLRKDISDIDFSDKPLYMLYTSGSTGVPKGVLKSHKAVWRFMESYIKRFGFDNSLIIGNQTPFFFDASARDIYLMLSLGATLEILPTEYFAMPPTLIRYMNDRRINFISWVPSALSVIVQLNTFKAVIPEYLKYVLFVGEVMPMKHLNKWREVLPDVKYVNLYGSTEVAGISCCYEVEGEFANEDVLPMGRPLDNCKIYLVDGDSIIKETEHVGELYIVSDSIAIGYFRDEQKTAANFLYRDFGDGVVRCFRTGDMAKFDKDGNLIFSSRADFQIKHMGHRLELGEIEAVAGALDCIQRCACLHNEKKDRIVLFCQVKDGTMLKGNDIKAELTKHLSSYMVPDRVNILESLPYNANNKIDRQKLKEML